MAILQRQLPRSYTQAAVRASAARAPRRARSAGRAAVRPLPRATYCSIAGAALLGALLVAHVAGCARMTAASYRTVRLTEQLASVRLHNQMWQEQLDARRAGHAVAEWARTNGMTRDGRPMVVLTAGSAGG
ncbi:MAG: hypothetical protein IT208_06220 [Chthonomonadales bacterium]|nr:hypothetical protein [Chthonomonadales bacterium]